MTDIPAASIVIPTRGRPDYLDVTLASVVPEAAAAGAEVLVVSDGDQPPTAAVAHRHGTRLVTLTCASGINAARNAGVAATVAPLLVFIDDDVEAPAGWLRAILTGVAAEPDCDVFGGPIRARLQGGGPRSCGREPPPITTLDLGLADRDVDRVWGSNMSIRRRAFDRVGPFEEGLPSGGGDEEDWQRRYVAAGGRVRYLAGAGIDHRRTAADATLRALVRTAYSRGRVARRYDVRRAAAPPITGELRTLAGCLWHIVRRRCANGIVLSAHTAGRLHEALAPAPSPSPAQPPP
jgi:glycosyltransferase involved in cell wall biosynthesis